jgi:ABC-type transporter Mla subunit MlaD
MSVQSQYHIYRDASASLVWRTILGANAAIAIATGNKDAGSLTGTIPQSRDSNQVELDEVLLPFHDGARSGLRTTLSQLGPALSNHADLANDLNLYRSITPNADIAGSALRGEVQDSDLRALVRNAGQAARALSVGTDASQTQQFVESAANALQDLGGNPAHLMAAIKTFSSVFVDGSHWVFEPYTHLFSKADVLVHALDRAAPQIVPTLDQFNPALSGAQTLLTDANPLVHHLAPAVDAVARTARVGTPLLRQLKPGLTQLQDKVLPGLAAKYPEEGGKAIYQIFGPAFVGLGTLSAWYNSGGELANLTAGIEEPTATELLPCTLDFSHLDAVVCSSLSNALQEFFSGGTSLLQGLVKKPGGASIYGPILKGAQRVQGQLNGAEQALAKLAPATARALFSRHGG